MVKSLSIFLFFKEQEGRGLTGLEQQVKYTKKATLPGCL